MTPLQLLGVALLLLFLFFAGNLLAIGGYRDTVGISQDMVVSTCMMVMFIMMLISCANGGILLSLFQTLCNGIPGVSGLMDFGSLSEMWHQAPEKGVEMFLDTMLVSFFMNLTSMLFVLWDQNAKSYRHILGTMARVFLNLVAAVVVTVFVVNVFCKATGTYKLIVNIVSGLIAAFTLPAMLNPILKITVYQKLEGMVFFAALVALWDTQIVKQFRKAFKDAAIYCLGALALEQIFGSLQGIVQFGSALLASFAPCVIMLIGIWIMLKAGFSRR